MRYGSSNVFSKVIATIAVTFLLVFAPNNSARADGLTIVAFGDSLTQGFGLPVKEGFVPQLGAWLGARGRTADTVRLINAGVSGDTTAGGAARIDWTLTQEVDAMILTLGGNDLLRGIDPAVSRANLEKILQAAQSRKVPVLLVGMIATRNMGPDYKARFDRIYPDLAKEYETLYAPDFFAGLIEADGILERETLRARMQADGIHPNKDGVRDIVKNLGPDVLKLIDRAVSRGQ